MTDPAARSAPETGAGVFELLRLFKHDQAAADEYVAACLEQAKR
jgi:amidase